MVVLSRCHRCRRYTRRSVLAARSVDVLGRKETELPWDRALLDMLDRTGKLSCKPDLTKSTVKCRVRSVLLPRSYGEKVVREQQASLSENDQRRRVPYISKYYNMCT